MKSQIIFKVINSLFAILFLSSCGIEGEEICGTWNASGDYGTMALEITPWEGEFHGYLLSYSNGEELLTGAKEEEYVVLSNLVFKNGAYDNGKFFFGLDKNKACDISMKLIDINQLKVVYNCDGQQSEEIWTRDGYEKKSQLSENTSAHGNPNSLDKQAQSIEEQSENFSQDRVSNNTTTTGSSAERPTNTDTQRQNQFYIIGFHEVISANDNEAIGTAIEVLWNKVYNQDFSSQLDNILNQERMYVTYSDYDSSNENMTITIGYKVSNLSSIPGGLKGIRIPANDFYVSQISGQTTDYEGEEWAQIQELLNYRAATSVDFEVYTFDENYELTNAEIWIAAK